jgi:hypothetical protein
LPYWRLPIFPRRCNTFKKTIGGLNWNIVSLPKMFSFR